MELGWTWLGRIEYRAACSLQEAVRERVLGGGPESLIFCEHDPVITLGRSADRRHVLAVPPGVSLEPTSRGGDVSAHAPGQLVIYPVVRLTRGVVAHVETVGRAIAAELAERGVPAAWRRDPAGVWVAGAKIAACGIHVKRRVAIHGFALNVTNEPLALFSAIVPCGLAAPVTAVAAHAAAPELPELAAALAARIAAALGRAARLAENPPATPLSACDRPSTR